MKITRVESLGIRLQIVAPPRDLAPYVTAYYRTEAVPGLAIEDWLPPEWANIRVGSGEVYEAGIGGAALQRVPAAVISGPTSKATRLRIASGEFWGIGLLPLGFVKFVRLPASAHADRFCDASSLPLPDPLRRVIEHLAAKSRDFDCDVKAINAGLRAMLAEPVPQQSAIVRTHEAVLSDRFGTVADLAAHLGMGTRTLERFAARVFGFSPKLLLRRQRFLRSLARFMVDPSMKWVHSLDSHYHDQAHFVREFKHFMLMRPSDYAALDHPIAGVAVAARRAALGEPMQVLHRPIDLAQAPGALAERADSATISA